MNPPLLHGWHEHRLAVMLAICQGLPLGPAIAPCQQTLDMGSKERHDRGRPPEGSPEAGEVAVGRMSGGGLQHACSSNVRSA